MKTLPSLLAAGLALAAFAAPITSGNRLQEKDIVDTLAARNAMGTASTKAQFTILVQLVTKAGLADTLKGAGPFTLLAPTDAAFAKIPSDVIKKISDDPTALKQVLTYHVIPGKVMSSGITTMKADTVEGEKLAVKVGKKGPRFGKAKVVEADIVASNGVIHAIDTVLLPPKVARSLGLVPPKKKGGKVGGVGSPTTKPGGGAAGPSGGGSL